MRLDMRLMSRSVVPLGVLTVLVVGMWNLLASLALGQVTAGSLTGIVTDPSGEVVPGAAVAALSKKEVCGE